MTTIQQRLREGCFFQTAEQCERVVRMIDEIAFEFLDIEEVDLPVKIGGEVDWEATAKLMELRNIIRLKWFKRHFGE